MKVNIPWTPIALGDDLKYWHKGDEKGITLSGNEVTLLNNLGSLGGTFTPGGASEVIQARSGNDLRTGLSFSNDFMVHSEAASNWKFLHDGYTAWHWAGILRLDQSAIHVVWHTNNGSGISVGAMLFPQSNGTVRFIINDGVSSILVANTTDTLKIGVTHSIIIAVDYGGSTECQIWIDGVSAGTYSFTGTPTSSDPIVTYRLGRGTNGLIGHNPEAFISTGWPTSDDITRIHSYLKDRWHEWNPSDSDKLQLWFNADNGVTLTDGYVSAWNDLSDSNFDADQSNTAKQPHYTGETLSTGKQAILFDGVDDFLDLTGISIAADKHTIAAVVETSDTVNYLFDALTGRFVLAPARTGGVSYYDGTWHSIGAASTDSQAIVYHLNNSTASTVYRDGISLGISTYADTAIGGSSAAIGAINVGTTAWWNGYLRELIIFSPALSDDELKKLFIYQARNSGTP